MKHTYRLLQQATIPPVKKWEIERGVLGNLDFKYMGSAEFEFGSLPKAMGCFLGSTEALVFGKVTVTLPIDVLRPNKGTEEVLVRYLVRESQQAGLIEFLQNWKTASRNFKEWNVSLVKTNDLVFCIDKNHETLMWNGKLGNRFIKEHAIVSINTLIKNEWCPPVPEEILYRLEETMSTTY